MINILSYPRSGNHLVRALVENITQSPTLGVFGGRCTDTPILSHNVNVSPVAYKQHFVEEIDKDRLITKSSPKYLILITRNPFDAISSHNSGYLDAYLNQGPFDAVKNLAHHYYRKWKKKRRLVSSPFSIKNRLWTAKYNSVEEYIDLNLLHWLSLHQFYTHWDKDSKLLLKFENLLDSNLKSNEIKSLHQFLERSNYAQASLTQIHDEENLQGIYNSAKKSLIRPPKNRNKYRQLIYDCYISSDIYNDNQFSDTKKYITDNYLS